ncbi:MAG: glycosyltransferase family 4 protein [Marinifilaceae bacterium]|nr:glycosyltransferase family 4 protein [Marinifilaceae bacterium]
MKIFFVGTRGIPNIMGGVESHCEELAPRLAELGYDITVVRRDSYVTQPLTSWRGVRLIDVASPKIKAFEAIVHTFRAINVAKREGADIVHIHAIGPALLTPYARLLGMKVLFTHHGPDYDRDKWGFMAKSVLKIGERMGVAFANRVIVISNVIKELVRRKYGRQDGVELIRNGVSAAHNIESDNFLQSIGVERRGYLLAMCRFVPEKNLHHLIEAYSRLRGDKVKLVIAGDADFEDSYSVELKRKAKECGVILTGVVKGEKKSELLSWARAFVLPSSHEGLPIALLEAMSYSLPVVVSDIPANLEVELPSESYFRCGDIEELKLRLQNMMEEPFVSVEYNMSIYNWDKIAGDVAGVYDSL